MPPLTSVACTQSSAHGCGWTAVQPISAGSVASTVTVIAWPGLSATWDSRGTCRTAARAGAAQASDAAKTTTARTAVIIGLDMASLEEYLLHPIGTLRSTLHDPAEAPKQGSEGAPDAWLDVAPPFAHALSGIEPGDQLLVLTWLHRADRRVLEVHPRGDRRNPLTGV